MMKPFDFVQAVRQIADDRPTYRTGGDGSDGTCDCIGLIMGAIGKDYDMHSTNYFARFEMQSLDVLQDESQMHEGSVVYKSRQSTAQLDERYQEDGTHYTGDMLDYYHVGVVTSLNPLEITHCTKTDTVNGITYDGSIKGWSHFGDPMGVEYKKENVTENGTSETVMHDLAIVHTEDGNPVKMRSTPSTKLPYIAKVPNGAQVEVLESAEGWATIRWNGQRGYMMTDFLRVIGAVTAETEMQTPVTITISASAAMELEKALSGVL